MGIKELFSTELFDGDVYMNTFLENDTFYEDMLKKFVSDSVYNELLKAMDVEDYDKIFLYAHTLKGTCANLGIVKLSQVASMIASLAKEKDIEKILSYKEDLLKNYAEVKKLINKL